MLMYINSHHKELMLYVDYILSKLYINIKDYGLGET